MAINLFELIKDAVSDAQQRNRENPNVKTAPRSVFDKIREKVEEGKQKNASSPPTQENNVSIFDFIKEKVKEVKQKNEADPEEDTADSSVFNSLEEKIRKLQEENERLKNEPGASRQKIEIPSLDNKPSEVKTNNPFEMPNINIERPDINIERLGNRPSEVFSNKRNDLPNINTPPPANYNPNDERPGTIAMTNSMGGSLAIRVEPDFGAGQMDVRIPDMSRITLIQYSQHAMMLDGKKTRWVLIDYQGIQGWIPESYLNFN